VPNQGDRNSDPGEEHQAELEGKPPFKQVEISFQFRSKNIELQLKSPEFVCHVLRSIVFTTARALSDGARMLKTASYRK
jgi:hypothetical protein